MNIDLRHFRYVLAVAETLHFGRAADALFISQPALSRQIREVEEALGVALFVRTTRTVQLTPAGGAFVREARRAVQQFDHALETARRAQQGEIGLLRIGFLPSAASSFLPSLITTFRAAYPDVAITLHELLDDDQIRRLDEGQLDVGIVRAVPSATLETVCLITEPYAAVLPSDHRLAGEERISVASLADETFILRPRREATESHDEIIALCRRHGFSPRIVQEATTAHAILGLVAAGLGISVLAASYQTLHREGVTLIPLHGSTTSLRLVVPRNHRAPEVQRFVEVAERVASTVNIS